MSYNNLYGGSYWPIDEDTKGVVLFGNKYQLHVDRYFYQKNFGFYRMHTIDTQLSLMVMAERLIAMSLYRNTETYNISSMKKTKMVIKGKVTSVSDDVSQVLSGMVPMINLETVKGEYPHEFTGYEQFVLVGKDDDMLLLPHRVCVLMALADHDPMLTNKERGERKEARFGRINHASLEYFRKIHVFPITSGDRTDTDIMHHGYTQEVTEEIAVSPEDVKYKQRGIAMDRECKRLATVSQIRQVVDHYIEVTEYDFSGINAYFLGEVDDMVNTPVFGRTARVNNIVKLMFFDVKHDQSLPEGFTAVKMIETDKYNPFSEQYEKYDVYLAYTKEMTFKYNGYNPRGYFPKFHPVISEKTLRPVYAKVEGSYLPVYDYIPEYMMLIVRSYSDFGELDCERSTICSIVNPWMWHNEPAAMPFALVPAYSTELVTLSSINPFSMKLKMLDNTERYKSLKQECADSPFHGRKTVKFKNEWERKHLYYDESMLGFYTWLDNIIIG